MFHWHTEILSILQNKKADITETLVPADPQESGMPWLQAQQLLTREIAIQKTCKILNILL